MRPKTVILVCTLGLLGSVATAWAQGMSLSGSTPGAFDERGVRLGFQLQGGGIASEDPPPDPNPESVFVEDGGGGVVLNLGYTFTPAFALQLAFGTLVHDTTVEDLQVAHTSLVLEAQYRFLPGERARPYLFAGLGGTTLEADSDDYDSEVDGGMAVVGAGMHVFMTRHLLLDLAGRIDLMNWERIRMRRERADGSTIQLDRPVDDGGLAAELRFGILWQM
jgi:hypothetical protein